MIKKAIFVVLTGALLITTSCSGENGREYEKESANFETSSIETEYQDKTINDETPAQDNEISPTPTLGGISLGDSPDKVIDVLGHDYSESTEPDIAGLIGEDLIVWSYETVLTYTSENIGKSSKNRIDKSRFETDQG